MGKNKLVDVQQFAKDLQSLLITHGVSEITPLSLEAIMKIDETGGLTVMNFHIKGDVDSEKIITELDENNADYNMY